MLGVVLAGGAARRFGADKALAQLRGMSLLERVAARARPQVDQLAISLASSQQADAGLPTILDRTPGQGPLGGVATALYWAAERAFALVATFPCDTPFFPVDLVARLRASLSGDADCAMARRGGQEHRAFALWRTRCEPEVSRALAAGRRSLQEIGDAINCVHVDFPLQGDGPGGDAFFNINRREDLALAQSWLDRAQN